MSSILRTYRQNEAVNAHSESALLLAEAYGTPAEEFEAHRLLDARNRRGYSLPEAHAFQAEIARRYLPLAKRDAAKAAGPELLEACKQALTSASLPDKVVTQLRAAVAKAEGL